MKITILSLFPGMFDGFLNESIIKRAIAKKLVSFDIINIRDFTKLKKRTSRRHSIRWWSRNGYDGRTSRRCY